MAIIIFFIYTIKKMPTLPDNCYTDEHNKNAICLSLTNVDITCPNSNIHFKNGDTIISNYYEKKNNAWTCNTNAFNCNNNTFNSCLNTTSKDGNQCVILSDSTSSSIHSSNKNEKIVCIDSSSIDITNKTARIIKKEIIPN